MNNKELLASRYMMKLLHLAPSLVKEFKNSPVVSINVQNDSQMRASITACEFPNSISVTDIEMLIRSPYSFYAKKILGLRKQDSIATEPKLSEFGSFAHKIIEHYTNDYQSFTHNKVEGLLGICDQVLGNTLLPAYTKKTWKVKFKAIAEEFIKFDENLRASRASTYSEIKGQIKIKILDQEIKITAIADRIEVNNQGIATILDYKTGALPTQKEVLAGLSPQLVIEAIILLNGGFNIKVSNVEKLIYVKIASSEPFIQTIEIDITANELASHFNGLKSLLEYYVTCKTFSTEIDLSKYNNYIHLARKM